MSWMIVVVIFINQKQIEIPSGSAATEGSGSLLCCCGSGQCLGLTLESPMPSIHPLPPGTNFTSGLCSQNQTLPRKKSSQRRGSAHILLCYLVVDVHVSQANAELPSTGDHSTVSGCALPLQLQDAAHVLKKGAEAHTEHTALLPHSAHSSCAHLLSSPALCSPLG